MKIIQRTLPFILLLLYMTTASIHAQLTPRPPVWGIAKITFTVTDFQLARDYYGRFLGFEEAFSYSSGLGKVISFKVNDRQFLEFVEDKEAKTKKRMVSVSFECDDVDAMRRYLSLKGLKTPEKTTVDGAGNEVILVNDPSGNAIEFVCLKPEGLHRKSKGRFLSERRISKRIHHVGLFSEKIMDNDPFYVGILSFKEIVRYPEDKTIPPVILYLGMDDCIENVEHYSPNDPNFNHPCLLVDDMQETIYTLRERKIDEKLAKPMIGKGKRWILNLVSPDDTKMEFTEAFCVR